MNHSKFALEALPLQEKKEDRTPELKEKEATLVRILEAIQEIQSSKSWSSLKSEVLDGLVTRLERELREEARRNSPDTNKLNRIAGQLEWAERFSDLSKLENRYRAELTGIRLQLGNTN